MALNTLYCRRNVNDTQGHRKGTFSHYPDVICLPGASEPQEGVVEETGYTVPHWDVRGCPLLPQVSPILA